jgi:hypothetical protein
MELRTPKEHTESAFCFGFEGRGSPDCREAMSVYFLLEVPDLRVFRPTNLDFA